MKKLLHLEEKVLNPQKVTVDSENYYVEGEAVPHNLGEAFKTHKLISVQAVHRKLVLLRFATL